MTVTIEINGKPVDVCLTPAQVASIEAQQKPKRFEFKYPGNNNYIAGATGIAGNYSDRVDLRLEYRRYRLAEQAAINSLARNKRANRLEALAEQLEGLVEFKAEAPNWHIIISSTGKIYSPDSWNNRFQPEVVYMTKACAIEICRMLNEGEVEL
jgi:hypothetical protein